MSQFVLYREPTVLDTLKHRQLKLQPLVDHSVASHMQSCFLAAAEFTHAAREFTIVFVRASTELEGRQELQPVVLLGTEVGENLFVDAAPGSTWDARYVPAYIRRYPFWTAEMDGSKTQAVLIDAWWRGFSETEGEPLYEADGQPAKRLAQALSFLERFDIEAEHTLAICKRLIELDLLREMTVTATLPGDTPLALDGFFAVDETKLRALPDALVAELHRNGTLAILYAHLTSLDNLQSLLDRKARRMPAATP